MRKKLIAAIIVVLLLIAAAVGVILYLENKPAGNIPESTGAQTDAHEDGDPVETTEETVGLSLATEDPDEVSPEDSFGDDDIVPPATGSETPGQTEDPDANETPADKF